MENSKNDLVYLKQNIAMEALSDQWYAWSQTISPATYAMNIKGRHLSIMKSYIDFPQIHAAAVKKPEMKGGPFIDYNGGKVEEIKELYNRTLTERSNMLDFANAVHELNQLLENEAKGYSLEPLYEKVPELLRGYVELFYDLNNNASYRFFEALLYKSEFYTEEAQSITLQFVHSDDQRSFILSTPRLEDAATIHLNIPFRHLGIDELYKMRTTPNSYDMIKNKLNISEEQEELFSSFFTTDAPRKYEKYTGNGIRTRYFGHACILVETKNISILVDPVISYTYDAELHRYTYNDLPDEIDYIVITHNHQDHILIETLLQLRHKTKKIIVPRSGAGDIQDPNLKLMFNQIGFDNILEISELETIQLDGCEITGFPFIGEHSDLDIRCKLCYHVKFQNDFSVLFVADSCNKDPKLYQRLQSIYGDIDVIFLGMECDGAPLSWLYGPIMPKPLEKDKDQSRRLAGSNFDQGMDLVKCFNPSEVFVYAMGMEPWLEFISSIKYTDLSRPIVESNKLVEKCKEAGINAERLYGEKTIEYKRELISL